MDKSRRSWSSQHPSHHCLIIQTLCRLLQFVDGSLARQIYREAVMAGHLGELSESVGELWETVGEVNKSWRSRSTQPTTPHHPLQSSDHRSACYPNTFHAPYDYCDIIQTCCRSSQPTTSHRLLESIADLPPSQPPLSFNHCDAVSPHRRPSPGLQQAQQMTATPLGEVRGDLSGDTMRASMTCAIIGNE